MKPVKVSFLNRKGTKLKIFLPNESNTENQIMIFAKLVIKNIWLTTLLLFSGLWIDTFYLTRNVCSSERLIKTPVLCLSFLFCKDQNVTWTCHSNQFYLSVGRMLESITSFLRAIVHASSQCDLLKKHKAVKPLVKKSGALTVLFCYLLGCPWENKFDCLLLHFNIKFSHPVAFGIWGLIFLS